MFRGVMSDLEFLFHFSMTFPEANRIAPDGSPMSHEKDARFK